MKVLIVPVFGLFLAACTYQFAPTGSDSKLLNAESSGEQTVADVDFVPADPDSSGPGAPGGEGAGGPPTPDPDADGSGGSMPDFPDLPGGG